MSDPVATSNILPSIQMPRENVTFKAKVRQVLLHNARVHYVMLVFLVFFAYLAIANGSSNAVLYAPVIVTIVYFILIFLPVMRFEIILDGRRLIRRALFTRTAYEYRDIHKIVLIRNLTHYDGRFRPRTSGMAVLLLTTSGIFPGFPFYEFAHESYMTKADMEKLFQTFHSDDRLEIKEATRAQVMDMVGSLRAGEKQGIATEKV